MFLIVWKLLKNQISKLIFWKLPSLHWFQNLFVKVAKLLNYLDKFTRNEVNVVQEKEKNFKKSHHSWMFWEVKHTVKLLLKNILIQGPPPLWAKTFRNENFSTRHNVNFARIRIRIYLSLMPFFATSELNPKTGILNSWTKI